MNIKKNPICVFVFLCEV